MQRFILSIFIILFSVASAFAQRIETDIFGNLVYESRDRNYKAEFRKDIFDNLIFTDSRKNKITLEKKYLNKEYPSVLQNKDKLANFFRDLFLQYRREDNYVATYKIDIFDKLIIEDNRGYKLQQGNDIFGNNQIEEEFNGVKTSIKRNIHGGLDYSSGSEKASLKKDIFDKWTYEDSLGNKFQFAPKTWKRLINRLRTDEEVFLTLIDQFFADM